MKINPLPPMNSLVVFESAARHLSFTMAAEELHVTQGAVSRQIRCLEAYLGKPLFERANRSVKLTAMGHRYAQAVRQSLLGISEVTDEVRSWKGAHQITVATTSAMASLWLIPKIAEFQRDHDDIELRFVAIEQVRDLNRVEYDIALFYCRTPPLSMRSTTLFHEEVFPVCSPEYLERHGPFTEPAALLDCTLLSLEDADQDWMSWKQWFSSVGVTFHAPRRRLNTNNYSMLVQAAIMNQGVALGWSQLVDDYLESGQLVRPLETVLRTEAKFCLLERADAPLNRRGVRAFHEWLIDTIPKEVGGLGLT